MEREEMGEWRKKWRKGARSIWTPRRSRDERWVKCWKGRVGSGVVGKWRRRTVRCSQVDEKEAKKATSERVRKVAPRSQVR